MSFVSISTANPLGKRPLNFMMRHQSPPVYAGLLGWIGAAATPGDYDTDTQVLGALVSMGAISAAEAAQIDAGTLSLDDLPVNMTMINEAISEAGGVSQQTVLPLPGVAPVSITPLMSPAATPSAITGPAQIPTGSTIAYTLSWSPGIGNLTLSTAAVEAAFAKALASLQSQMSVISSSVTQSFASFGSPGYTVQFNVYDGVGHARIADAQSVLDSAARSVVGSGNVTASSITGVYAPGSSAGQPGATGITAWVEQNALWLAVLAVALVTVPSVIRRL